MDEASREELVEELERRIDELEGLDEAELGRFTPLDWVICVVGALALPLIALIWFAG
jgi:hypothetical protein